MCGYEIVGIVSPKKERQKSPYLGTDEWLIQNKEKYKDIPLHVVPDNPFVRKNLFDLYKDAGFHIETEEEWRYRNRSNKQ